MKYKFLIDLDSRELFEGCKKDWIKTRKNILKTLKIKWVKYIRHYSVICPKCGLHFQINKKEYETKVRCPACSSLAKKIDGRGLHLLIFAESPKKLSDERICYIEYLLGSDEGRQHLSLLKFKEGVKNFSLLFSKSMSKSKVSKRCLNCQLRRRICELLKKDYKKRF